VIARLSFLISLLGAASIRRRVLGFAASGALACVVGFVVVAPPVAERLIMAGGYFYILGVFAALVYFAARVVRARRDVAIRWIQRPGWAGVMLLLAAGFTVWSDTFRHKVLFDEYVLQGTAWHMHATKEIGTPIRAYDIAGTWLAIDTFLDKRPFFFTFLVSLLHDVTGFRLENAFALNVCMAAICLGLVYWVTRAITGRRGPALLAVGLARAWNCTTSG
jgi:hypothetical protein